MECRVKFLPLGVEVTVKDGTNLLFAAQEAGVFVNSVCGGEGVCGKCRVRILRGEVEHLPTAYKLRDSLASKGYVLACRSLVKGDISVEVPKEAALSGGKILMDGETSSRGQMIVARNMREMPFEPLVRKVRLRVEEASVASPVADYERLRTALRKALKRPEMPFQIGYKMLRQLGRKLREKDGDITVTIGKRQNTYEIMALESGNKKAEALGVAVDVGTTTVVVHLVDLGDGKTLGMEAKYNSQIAYGEDYITRIIYAEQNDAFGKMQSLIITDINELVDKLCRRLKRRHDEIVAVVVAGNTAMMHFLLGLDAHRLRREPFVPVANIIPPIRALEVGIKSHSRALLYPLPSVAVYIGADITGGIVAVCMDRTDKLSLFIDIGTNGEVVIGNKEFLACCSCSAGPAFEGSGVECGMRATKGAIESVKIERRGDSCDIHWSTIGNRPPLGICGSGLIDIIAKLFYLSILERTGRFNRTINCDRLFIEDNVAGFTIVRKGEEKAPHDITINEIDIANILRSKAAVYAAIKILLSQLNLPLEAIEQFYLAGGFGNYVNIASAITIGMLPDVPHDRIAFVGNTAIAGAKMALISESALERIEHIAHKMTYIDLMMNQQFMDEFVKANFIPHTNISEFPSVSI
ncbi:MAG: ASKHA domain-containing protein [Planctomycetota bacterium]|nr:ASKHA domain-containing protein [Planctomycetota bacterium]